MKKKKQLLVLEYSYYFGELPKIFALFILGFLLQIGWYSILIYLLLAPYRSFTGGFHLKTHWGCMLSSIVLYIIPILVAKYINISQDYIVYIMTGVVGILSVVFIFKYAPADTENIPILSKKERKVKRIKSYISLVILLIIILVIPDKIISYMLLYGIFLQNLTLTPIAYKLTKNKYSYEVYTEETV
ncbi:MAG: accessory gene regulator B family protein [Clostridia bacterium]|jgi:accessory gene regulator B|nr:accessory gene regulator B family protein [Clostridia bacterium]